MSSLKKETYNAAGKLGNINVVILDDDASINSEDDNVSIKSEDDDVLINSEDDDSVKSEDDDSVKSEDDVSVKSEDDNVLINSEDDDSVKSEDDDVSMNSEDDNVSIKSADDVSLKSEDDNVLINSEDDDSGKSEDYESDESDKNDNFDESNAGWASAMGKVLNIGKRKRIAKTLVLSKARKLSELKTIKTEKIVKKNVLEKTPFEMMRSKRIWAYHGCYKPHVLDKEYEVVLQKVAVRGIVQIFNAVKTYQQGLEKSDNSKKETKLQNSSFFKLLKKGSKSVDVKSLAKTEIKDEENMHSEKWNVLRDNFMLDSKLKDWDKHEEK